MTVSGRRLLLRDEDTSTVIVGKNERRLNTLAHYRVPDGCTLAVVARYSSATRSNGQLLHFTYHCHRRRLVAGSFLGVHFLLCQNLMTFF